MRTLPFTSFLRSYCVIFLLLGIFQLSTAQNQTYQQAQAAAKAGNFATAASLLEQHLQAHPEDLPARLLQAHNFSWWRRFDLSIPAFNDIIRDHPELAEAKIGQGFAYLWAKQPKEAVRLFRAALLDSPRQTDAWKGLALALEADGNAAEANAVFADLAADDPTNPEYRLGLARTFQTLGDYRSAKKSLQAVGAKEQLRQLKLRPAKLEADLWGGFSQVEGISAWNIRAAQLSYRLDEVHFLYARYDNSLSMDNLDYLRNGQAVPAWIAGGVKDWNDQWSTRLEAGVRTLPLAGTLPAFRIEQMLQLPNAFQVKGGIWAGHLGEGTWEGLGYASIFIPLNDQLGIEPTYYHSREQLYQSPQHRFSLTGKWHNEAGVECLVGTFYGKQQVESPVARESIIGAYTTALVPLSPHFRLLLAGTYEQGLLDNTLSVSAGLRYRLLK